MSFFNNKGLLGIGQGALNDYLSQFQRARFVREGQVSDLISKINDYGTVSANRYELQFIGPQKNPINIFDNERLSVMCEEIALPMKSLSTQEHRTHGPIRKLPYTETFSSVLQITFRLGKKPTERLMFEEWQNLIINPYTHNLGYYNDYISDLLVIIVNKDEEPTYKIKIFEVYPENIGEISLSSGIRDSYLKQTISFAFKSWAPWRLDTDEPVFPTPIRNTSIPNVSSHNTIIK